jgi:hypothetical protein
MRKIYFLIFVLCFCARLFGTNSTCILMIPLYSENNYARVQEYLFCLDKNLQNPAIEKIHVVFDTSCEKCNFILLNELYKRPITIDFIEHRATYNYFFKRANELYPGRKIIVSNADIFFNETLEKLSNYDLAHKFLAITRWQYNNDGSITPYLRGGGISEVSQDVWIFSTPIKPFPNDNIELGSLGCDGKIARQAYLSGLEVINPSLSVQCCHVHLTNVRHYPARSFKNNELMSVPSSELPSDTNKIRPITWDEIVCRFPLFLYAGSVPSTHPAYKTHIGLALNTSDAHHIKHDVTQKLPLPDNSVDRYQSEDVFEHIVYGKLVDAINEIYRVLKPGGLFRLSIPDYRCDVLYNRSIKDANGEIIFDPYGGGNFVDGKVVGGGHVWFPTIENVSALLEKTRFFKHGSIHYLHYYDIDGTSVTNPIDYSLGYVKRTPDHDDRVASPYRAMSIVVDLYKK